MSIKANKDNATFISNVYEQEQGYKASATVTYGSNPVDGQNINLNGTVFTYRTTPAVANDVAVGGTISIAINNLLTEALPATATYTKVGTNQIFIEYKTIGVAGNAYTISSNFLTVPSTLSGGSDLPDSDWVDNTPSIEYKLPKIAIVADTMTTALISTDVLVEGDEVRLYNGTDGLIEGILGTTTNQSVSMLDYTTANGFTCTYDYQSKFHKHNITKDTTVSDITGWTTGTSLPGILQHSQAIVTKGRVYLLGGHISGAVSTVYTAPINVDGTLGAWTTGTSLPGALYASQAIVTKNRVYLLGGVTTSDVPVSTVYTAPINIDGTLGSWTTGTSLPSILHNSQAIVTKGRVYLLGGNISGAVSTVYTAPFADGWGIEQNNYQIVTLKYTADISLLGLTVVPTKAYFDKSVSIATDTADIEANIDIETKMPTTEASDTYDNVNEKFIKTYNKIEQQGRAMKYKIEADEGVEVTKVNIEMNKQG